MFEASMGAKPANGRGRNFWLLTGLGIVTCGSLVRRSVRAFQLLTPWGWVYVALSFTTIIIAWTLYERLHRGFSSNSEKADETFLERFQKATEWLYIMVNVGVFGLMHFIPAHLVR